MSKSKGKTKAKPKAKARRRSVVGTSTQNYDGLRKLADKHDISLNRLADFYITAGLKTGKVPAPVVKAGKKTKAKAKVTSKPKPKVEAKKKTAAPKPKTTAPAPASV